MKLSRSIIKRYGISKKAWAVARAGTHKAKTGAVKMAKRRSRVRYIRSKRSSHRRSGSSGILGKVANPMIGAVGVVAYEKWISPMIPLNPMVKNLAEIGIGAYASNKGGVIGASGQSLLAISSYKLVNQLIGGTITGSSSSQGTIYG